MAMNSEPNISQQPPISSVASTRPQHSSRTSPLPTTTTTTDKSTMAAAPTFVPAAQAFRPSPSSQSPYQLNMNASHLFEREPTKPVGTPFASTPPPIVRVLIRRLPINTTEESLRLMLVWSKEQAEIELLPVNTSEDEGFRSALLRFRTMAAALEAKSMLDGRSNISKDAEMVVEVLAGTPPTGRKNANEQLVANTAVTSAPGPSSLPPARQPARYNGFQSLDSSVSPTSNGAFPAHDFIHADSNAHYQSIFSALPFGNHMSERPRITGKSLISSDFGDDDETSDLLKDPVAYAESGATSQRRATAPQIPISRMGSLPLSPNPPQGSASLPHYMNSMSPVSAPGPAGPGQAPGLGYATNGHSYNRHAFPPVNPADQNPPCNTLYVGNLPIDTSEEELKAMFSKQRGYKRLCFRTKQNGPMCFVEFEDITFATKALHDLYGHPLHNSVKGGIRLSFSKNPLGVRSGQAPGQGSNNAMGSMNNSMMVGTGNGFSTHGPPPGLAAPPGLGSGRGNYNLASSMNTGGNRLWNTNYTNSFAGGHGHPWNTPAYNNGVAAGPNSGLNNNTSYLPRHMMGK